ncbi:MAG: peptidoglycan editing factor PgeF [Prevotella sp.]|jgi:YfiH family protein
MKPKLLTYSYFPGVTAFSTTRHGGVSQGTFGEFNINEYCGDDEAHIAANREALAQELGIASMCIVMPHQVHGVECRVVDKSLLSLPEADRHARLEGVDCVMTKEKGLCVGVSTADCIPVLLFDPTRNAVAAVHAGWRGTLCGISRKAVGEMALHFGSLPEELLAVVGPGISLKNFEVGQEVYDQFAEAGYDMNAIARHYAKWHLNLPLCNELQLRQAGLQARNIHQSGICTWDSVDDFFSARRLGQQSGRIFTAALLK